MKVGKISVLQRLVDGDSVFRMKNQLAKRGRMEIVVCVEKVSCLKI